MALWLAKRVEKSNTFSVFDGHWLFWLALLRGDICLTKSNPSADEDLYIWDWRIRTCFTVDFFRFWQLQPLLGWEQAECHKASESVHPTRGSRVPLSLHHPSLGSQPQCITAHGVDCTLLCHWDTGGSRSAWIFWWRLPPGTCHGPRHNPTTRAAGVLLGVREGGGWPCSSQYLWALFWQCCEGAEEVRWIEACKKEREHRSA